jgi:GNAT superfamily N-acetyltransferase
VAKAIEELVRVLCGMLLVRACITLRLAAAATDAAGMLDLGDGYRLRHARADDRAAMSLVCLRTGDAGRDASAREDDPDLLGLIYAVPYQVHAPEFAFVIEGPSGVSGYVLGTPDSEGFYRRLREEWFPPIAVKLADPGPEVARWRGSDWARHMIYHPPFDLPPALRHYPAHAHIDLLEEARGRGIGRRSMEHLMSSLREAGAPGIHLGVSPRNHDAQKFYARLGFSRIENAELPRDTVFMARQL